MAGFAALLASLCYAEFAADIPVAGGAFNYIGMTWVALGLYASLTMPFHSAMSIRGNARQIVRCCYAASAVLALAPGSKAYTHTPLVPPSLPGLAGLGSTLHGQYCCRLPAHLQAVCSFSHALRCPLFLRSYHVLHG